MKIGMNLLLWTDHVTEAHRPVLERLKSQGYDGVELPLFQLVPQHYEQVGRWLDELGLARTAVTVRTPADNPAGSDPAVRRKAAEQNRLAIDCCAAAGATTLCGPFHSALGHFSGAGPTEDELKWSVETLRDSAEHAARSGVMLALEYLNRFECYLLNCATDLQRYVERVDHPHCKLMYDTFHAHIEEKDAAAAIRALAKDCIHVHISENDRSTPGRGQVDWKTNFATLKAVGYDGWLTIEAFGLALPALAAATRIWRRMYDHEEQLSEEGLSFIRKSWAS